MRGRYALRGFALGYLALLLVAPVGMVFYRAFEHGIAKVVDAVRVPVNMLALPDAPSIARMAELGVKRISFGPRPMRQAMTAFRQAAEHVRDLVISRPAARLGVDDQHDRVGLAERRAHLLLHEPREIAGIVEVDPAGVDQRDREAIPVSVDLVSVSSDPGELVHNRLA